MFLPLFYSRYTFSLMYISRLCKTTLIHPSIHPYYCLSIHPINPPNIPFTFPRSFIYLIFRLFVILIFNIYLYIAEECFITSYLYLGLQPHYAKIMTITFRGNKTARQIGTYIYIYIYIYIYGSTSTFYILYYILF